MASEVEKIALLALVYRELSQYGACGPRTGPDDLLDDLEAIPDEVSLLRMVASGSASDLDWLVVRALDQPETLPALFADLGDLDPLRVEALLHVWPDDAPAPSAPLAALERWDDVEEAMSRFRDLGITATRGDVVDTYVGARVTASGRSREHVLDDYFDATMKGER